MSYPRRRWRKRFRERAIDSGLKYTKGCRGPVVFRYGTRRVNAVPITFSIPPEVFEYFNLLNDMVLDLMT